MNAYKSIISRHPESNKQLAREFIDSCIQELQEIPYTEWNLYGGRAWYQLNLRRKNITNLIYAFYWGDGTIPMYEAKSITEKPNRILKLDLSLNSLTTLNYDGLYPFKNLRYLDASYNQLYSLPGFEFLRNLHTLHLSHNNIEELTWLRFLRDSISVLNLSSNEISNLKTMPTVITLAKLHLDNNKLTNIDGIQAQKNLQELSIAKNFISDLSPCSALFNLTTLDASENKVSSLQISALQLTKLPHLRILILKDNPISNSDQYHNAFCDGSIVSLDGAVLSKKAKNESVKFYGYVQTIKSLKQNANEIYDKRLRQKHQSISEAVEHYKQKIAELKKDEEVFTREINIEREQCFNFVDNLSFDEAQLYLKTNRIQEIIQSFDSKK